MKSKICEKIFLTIVTVFAGISIMKLSVSAESIFLKDGQILNGAIVTDGATSITLRTKDNKKVQVPRGNILRIVYTDIKPGKIFIQTRDGKGIVAHIVDEDRESYTFRYDLYKPEEFTLKRKEVLFMVEKNPAGLKQNGETDTDRVNVTWQPPYDPVKTYNIYLKKKITDKYEIADTSGSTSLTLKKLNSNTEYYMIVTAVDKQGNESDPSNELKFKTKNIAPEKPSAIIPDFNGKKVTVKWVEAKDPDGSIKGYNIYNRAGSEKKKIANVKANEFSVPENVSIYDLEITSVDDLDYESDKVRVLLPLQMTFTAAPYLFLPSDKLGEMFPPGYGFLLGFGLRNLLFMNFETGINAGYIMFKGKAEENTDSLIYMPLTAYAGYHLKTGERFTIFPFIKAGGAYSLVKYNGIAGETDKSILDPVVSGGIAFTVNTDNYTFSAGGNYGVLYEGSGVKSFAELFLSCGLLF